MELLAVQTWPVKASHKWMGWSQLVVKKQHVWGSVTHIHTTTRDQRCHRSNLFFKILTKSTNICHWATYGVNSCVDTMRCHIQFLLPSLAELKLVGLSPVHNFLLQQGIWKPSLQHLLAFDKDSKWDEMEEEKKKNPCLEGARTAQTIAESCLRCTLVYNFRLATFQYNTMQLKKYCI